jgi:TDG/mug DNA glycosylase family protein
MAKIIEQRLRDRVGPTLRVLFVGINPGLRSAALGHHFAGYSQRFWKLLFESGLVPEPVGHEDDRRLPAWGYGITNVIARPTPGIDTLTPAEYAAGVRRLRRKVRRWRPQVVACVGITVYRALYPDRPRKGRVEPGLSDQRLEGARIFVLPNPSGRNAHYSYEAMLEAYRSLARLVAGDAAASPC